MIRKSFVPCIVLFVALVLPLSVYGQEATKSATESGLSKDRLEKIQQLKERVATKVAELKNQAMSEYIGGEIRSSGSATLTVQFKNNETQVKLAEDATLVLLTDGKQDKLTASQIKQGQMLYGEGEKTIQGFMAHFLYVSPKKQYLMGKISSIDKTEGTIDITTTGSSVKIDIEKTTKISRFEKAKGIQKIGFSKLVQGEIVYIYGSASTQEQNRSTAERILAITLATPISSPYSSITITIAPTNVPSNVPTKVPKKVTPTKSSSPSASISPKK